MSSVAPGGARAEAVATGTTVQAVPRRMARRESGSRVQAAREEAMKRA